MNASTVDIEDPHAMGEPIEDGEDVRLKIHGAP
jgi:hypothetical protein